MSQSRTNGVRTAEDGLDRAGAILDTDADEGLGDLLETATPRRRRRRSSLLPVLALIVLLGAGVYGGVWWWQSRGGEGTTARKTFTVVRGDLPITITEGGSLKALESEVYKCQVEGNTTIISLVPEGTVISQEDVEKDRILVELDSSNLRDRLIQQEITFANAQSSYEAAREDYEIQQSEGESEIKNGELNVKFGRMDLEHYVGRTLATAALDGSIDLLKMADQLHGAARAERRDIEAEAAKALDEVAAALKAPPEEGPGPPPRVGARPQRPQPKGEDLVASVTEPESRERLGGQALQTQRKHDADIELAIEKFKRAADEVVWTARLAKKGFVSQNELEADQLALKSSLIDLQQALSARELFLRYAFPKQAEEYLSIYRERGKELDRIKARARAALSQAEAKRRSAEQTYNVQKTTLEKLRDQVDHCIIRATKPGLVVYATTGGHWRHRGDPIEEGSTVRERQEIIKLPDIATLAVDIKVHESVVDKVEVGMPADIRIDAFPDMRLTGKVNKVAVLPDSSTRWLNPDLKQYLTDVRIDGMHRNLKPGMSAEVEILVSERKGVLHVPVQAVTTHRGKTVVYATTPQGEEEREVVLGESNEKFVEVVSGLREGEEVLLEAPQALAAGEEQEEEGPDEDAEDAEDVEEAPGPPRPTGPEGERQARPGGPRRPPAEGDQPTRRRPGAEGGERRMRPRGRRPSKPGTGAPAGRRPGGPDGQPRRPRRPGSRPKTSGGAAKGSSG